MASTTDTLNQYMNPATDYASGIAGKRATLNQNEENQTSDYLNRYRQAIMGQEGVPHMMNRIGQELNLPNLATNYNQVANQMTNLPQTYSNATRGFDVNANQLSRIVSTKQAALAPALTTAQQGYQTAMDERDKMIAATQAQQQKELTPYATEKDFMIDRFAREQTGFTADSQKELDTILAKANAGIQLTNDELNRANQLAVAEKNYQATIEAKKLQIASDEKIARQKTLVDLAAKF